MSQTVAGDVNDITGTAGTAFTVIVKEMGKPTQLLAVGVTLMVATVAALVLLIALNRAIFPIPDATRPIPVFEFVQLKTEPPTVPVKSIALVESPVHTDWVFTASITGVGFTFMVKTPVAPVQPFADGVTVIMEATGVLKLSVAMNGAILPVPVPASPMPVKSFSQLNNVPLVEPVKFSAAVVAPLHNTRSAGTTTFGVGLTVIV
jgi:hypothetical protein